MQTLEKHAPNALTGLLMPMLLALALLVPLFALPQPSMHVSHPFKVELCVALFLIAFLAMMRRLDGRSSSMATMIACSIAMFIVWSAASLIWATSVNSVAHHTLLWSLYLIVFLIFTGGVLPDANARFITTAFVVAAIILGVLCVFDYLSMSDFASAEGNLRIRYGKYAELLATISPVLWAAAMYARRRGQRVLIFAAALLSWVTTMLSLSKGAFLAGIVGFVIFFACSALFSARGFRKKVFVFAVIWLVVTVGTQIFFSNFSAVPSTTSYITGTADATRSTSAMRIFTWKVARQMATDHPMLGVGADNFGLRFNSERARFRAAHPDDTTDEIAEDFIVERAHNEPLQVLAELGIVGQVLFLLPLLTFTVGFVKGFRRPSPFLWAAIAGMAAFFISSQFSSFSFRAAQNGVAFFMVFAIAVNAVSRKRDSKDAMRLTPVYLASWLAILLMTAFCLTKVFAEYHAYRGERSEDYSTTRDHFRVATRADRGYAGAYLIPSGRAEKEGFPSEAAPLTRAAIDCGLGTSPIYSQLAEHQIAAGDIADAEDTYREALAVYPRSVYLHAEFAVFLEDRGKADAAAEQMAIARSLEPRQAKGWYLLIREGSVPTFYRSKTDQSIAPPAELLPSAAVQKYIKMIPGN